LQQCFALRIVRKSSFAHGKMLRERSTRYPRSTRH
jgi:hypothetical protein